MQIEAHHNSPSRIALFGGSFNPVHLGHMGIVEALRKHPGFDQVWVLPARRSPFKPDKPQLPDPLRWLMLQRVLGGLPDVVLSDMELRRPPPSYTHDTLVQLTSLLPQARLHLVLGWDAFAEFNRWHRAADILTLAGLVVFNREGAKPAPEDFQRWPERLPEIFRANVSTESGERIVTGSGRVLVQRLPVLLPDIAGRDILNNRRLEFVPPEARDLLEAYWRDMGTAPRPGQEG